MRSQRAFSTAAAAPPGFSTVPSSQSILTAPSSTTITHTICEGSAMDAKRFRTSTLSNLCAARSRSRACVEGVRVDRHPDLEPASLAMSASGVRILPWTWMAARCSGD